MEDRPGRELVDEADLGVGRSRLLGGPGRAAGSRRGWPPAVEVGAWPRWSRPRLAYRYAGQPVG
ncbi:MAG TPA: hypothetical protein VGJ54_20120, partial [Streptosporangiaceae bacterium]